MRIPLFKLRRLIRPTLVCMLLVLLKTIGLPSSDAGAVSSVEDAVLQPLADVAGRVVLVSDGDTVKIDVNGVIEKIRLAEIDTPESDQPYGDAAKHALFSLVYGKTVTVKLLPQRDRYQRAVGWLILEGQIINDLMVAKGHAWAWPRYVKRRHLYGLQQAAQEQHIGLWASLDIPIPPWKWRRSKRTQP